MRDTRMWVVGWVVAVVAFGCSGSVENGGPTPAQLISQYCAKVIAAGCGESATQEECQLQGAEARDDAVADGCLAEFDNAVRCAANADLSCARDVESACPAELDQLNECRDASGGQECIVGIGLDPNAPACQASCGELAMECWRTSPDEPLACTCIRGPATGATFFADECSSDLIRGLCG